MDGIRKCKDFKSSLLRYNSLKNVFNQMKFAQAAKLEIEKLKLCKALLISKNLFLEFTKMVKVETEILWNQIFSLVRNVARKTVCKLMDGMSL